MNKIQQNQEEQNKEQRGKLLAKEGSLCGICLTIQTLAELSFSSQSLISRQFRDTLDISIVKLLIREIQPDLLCKILLCKMHFES